MDSGLYKTEHNIFHFIPHTKNGDNITIIIGNRKNIIHPLLTKEELRGLADFIYGFMGEEKEWKYTRPIVGIDDSGQPITIDTWEKK